MSIQPHKPVRAALRVGVSVAAIASILVGAAPISVLAQTAPAAAQAAPNETQLQQLARDIERATSLRKVKDLQYLYAQYAEFGMWDEMAALFSSKAKVVSDGAVIAQGPTAIAAYVAQRGGGKDGLPVGSVNTQILQTPVVTLSVDGGSARGRWQDLSMHGVFGGAGDWTGGMMVNDYVKEDGVWKIAVLNLYPQMAGSADEGFKAVKPELPLVPYHYAPSLAGRPVPDEAGDADRTPLTTSLATLERTVSAMNDEDQVRNLQNMYGYYQDRKMWSDVVDLFADDGALEIAGVGVWTGPKSVRRALEINGPEGLKRGELNDQIQIGTVITIDPNGIEARARGTQLGMLTPKIGEAYWQVSIFENRYVKVDGKWRIREMRIYPRMKADYFKNWTKSKVIDPKPLAANAPDKPSPIANSPQQSPVIPAFFDHPVTGKPVTYPVGFTSVGSDRLLPSPATPPVAEGTGSPAARLTAARRKLAVSKAYDAIENVSNTFGMYLDDWTWDEFVENMAIDGTRPQGGGFYVGRDHMYRAMTQSHLAPPSLSNPRDGIRLHNRLQPVILVTPDGRSATIRTRMFLYFANQGAPGGWNTGMYPNDTAVLEDGVWKMRVGGVIDETYVNSRNYKEGWANAQPRGPGGPRFGEGDDEAGPPRAAAAAPGAPRPPSRNGNPINFAPDIPWTLFANYRRKDFSSTNWPEIKPMWFSYRNPVSGRTPPNYCPDILTCFQY